MSSAYQYDGKPAYADFKTIRVYYTGTEMLFAGQPFCWQETSSGTTKGLGRDVEFPNDDNVLYFAGWLHEDDPAVGKGGFPRFIDIVPMAGNTGLMMRALCGNLTGIAVGDPLILRVNIPTSASSAGSITASMGALELPQYFTLFSVVLATAGINRRTILQDQIRVLALAMQTSPTIAADGVGTGLRALTWIKIT